MSVAIERKQATHRVINLNKCEVWCPVHESEICVYAHCLAGRAVINGKVNFRDRCPHYVKLHLMGRVICAWPEDAPRDDPLDLANAPVL